MTRNGAPWKTSIRRRLLAIYEEEPAVWLTKHQIAQRLGCSVGYLEQLLREFSGDVFEKKTVYGLCNIDLEKE